MLKFLSPALFLIFAVFTNLSAENDIIINESTSSELTLTYELTNLKSSEIEEGTSIYTRITFDDGISTGEIGHPDLQKRIVTIGVPPNAEINTSVLSSEKEILDNVTILPVYTPGKDKNGIDIYSSERNNDIYQLNKNLPGNLIEISEVTQFRDLPICQISLNPIQYNPSAKQVTIYKKLQIKITYSNPQQYSTNYRQRGLLDKLYSEKIVNFEQSKKWQLPKPRTLSKSMDLPTGTYYKIEIDEDGLYKIPRSVLNNAGIDVSNLSLSNIRMFNNGGHMLTTRTDLDLYNPAYTQEIAIITIDENQNGLMDASDYILFYGKSLNSWFYEEDANDFEYQQHLYDNTNYYWLFIGSTQGLRMEEDLQSSQSNPVVHNYFNERLHFEEDLYNLLASGPDWYGNRFFGTTDSYKKTFDAEPYYTEGATATIKMRFKGGSGVHYGDNKSYRYTLSSTINSNSLFSNQSFTKGGTKTTTNANVTSMVSGTNTINIQYSGNLETCVAHVDWIEIFYPHAFSATDELLSFYTRLHSSTGRYTVENFSAKSDIYVLDVTFPTEPKILYKNLAASNGSVSFDLPSSDNPQQIITASLSGSAIKSISSMSRTEQSFNILSSSKQADFLIVTDNSFLNLAEDIKTLRSHLNTEIVSTEQLYFTFNSGVADPTAIRNFIRYAYYNWQSPAPSYVLLFGDGHYDYRNISITDSLRVPTYEIQDNYETNSRATDNYFVDLNNTTSGFSDLLPDLAIGRIPVQTVIDAEVFIEKLKNYETSQVKDGWQTKVTFVADDNIKTDSESEYFHQDDLEEIANTSSMKKFIQNKIYLSLYDSEPGGFGRVKPQAGSDIVDKINEGTLLVNYMGHGSPAQWAHEAAFVRDRDLNKIQNPNKYFFLIAATCDFGKFDNPDEGSFNEDLLLKENAGTIGAFASSRLGYAGPNAAYNKRFITNLLPASNSPRTIGEAKLLSTTLGSNDQKYILFGDPTMYLAAPKEKVAFTTEFSDTLVALSNVSIPAEVYSGSSINSSFNGEAVIIVNDAEYSDVSTGDGFDPIILPGPTLFKGQVTIANGVLNGEFIVPKTIRYIKKNSGRITIYAWNESTNETAFGYTSGLMFFGSSSDINDSEGPELDIYFENQESFTNGDLVSEYPVLIANVTDNSGINITGSAGHTINISIDNDSPKDISNFFTYNKDSYTDGYITYPLGELDEGMHSLTLKAFDNLNNLSEETIEFNVSGTSDIKISEVVNYPNPFKSQTKFTFQTNYSGAEITIKIYTLSGRLIQELYGFSIAGYNDSIDWDGRDKDGDQVANGVYLYKIILKDGDQNKSVVEKMVRTR